MKIHQVIFMHFILHVLHVHDYNRKIMRRKFGTLHRTRMRNQICASSLFNPSNHILARWMHIATRRRESPDRRKCRANLPTWQPAVSSATDSPALLLCVCQDCTRRQIWSSRKAICSLFALRFTVAISRTL